VKASARREKLKKPRRGQVAGTARRSAAHAAWDYSRVNYPGTTGHRAHRKGPTWGGARGQHARSARSAVVFHGASGSARPSVCCHARGHVLRAPAILANGALSTISSGPARRLLLHLPTKPSAKPSAPSCSSRLAFQAGGKLLGQGRFLFDDQKAEYQKR